MDQSRKPLFPFLCSAAESDILPHVLEEYTKRAKDILENDKINEDDRAQVQNEVSRVLILLPKLAAIDKFNRRSYVDFIFDAVTHGGEDISVVRSIRSELERHVRKHGSPVYWIFGDSPLQPALLGFLVSIVVFFWMIPWVNTNLLTELPETLRVVVETGAIKMLILSSIGGTLLSMIMRLNDFTEMTVFDPLFIFWSTFFRTILAALTALFLFTLMGQGIITIDLIKFTSFSQLSKTAGYSLSDFSSIMLLGFISGFSERFARRFIAQAEDKFDGLPPAPPNPAK